jgi:hypothetical protein
MDYEGTHGERDLSSDCLGTCQRRSDALNITTHQQLIVEVVCILHMNI